MNAPILMQDTSVNMRVCLSLKVVYGSRMTFPTVSHNSVAFKLSKDVMAEDYLFCYKAFSHVEDNDVLSSLLFYIHSNRNNERRKT